MPFSEMNKSALQILSPKDADGISYFDPGRNTYVIYYSANQSEERLRFTIGHEIGHIRMGHKGESTLARQIANYYSSYLLAPSPWIWTAKCKDSADIADIFMLSDLCAKYCFTRYTNWRKLHSLNNYEQTLLSLLS